MESHNSGVELKKFAPISVEIANDAEPIANVVVAADIFPRPGSKIRPQVSDEEAIRLAERLYGISTSDISELVSYDDKNFKIHSDR